MQSPLYQQVELLKKKWKAVVSGICSGVHSSLVCVLLLARLFHFDHAAYVTFLPKTITTAIGTASHAVGTAKAKEMGAVKGAMSTSPS